MLASFPVDRLFEAKRVIVFLIHYRVAKTERCYLGHVLDLEVNDCVWRRNLLAQFILLWKAHSHIPNLWREFAIDIFAKRTPEGCQPQIRVEQIRLWTHGSLADGPATVRPI